jgi:protein SCO1/2
MHDVEERETAFRRTVCAAVTIGALGFWLLWFVTDGGQVLTAEAARRVAAAENPQPVPPTELVDMNGRTFLLGGDGRETILVEFIYTRCPTLCTVLGESFVRLRDAIAKNPPARPVRLVSVTFDPTRDGRDQLRDYAERHGADGVHWTVARPHTAAALETLLRHFGIVVIADAFGGFEHNAAIHVVDGGGRLVGIFDVDADDAVLSSIRAVQ